MSAFYNKDIDSVRQEVNGSLEPLSNQQVKINQEKYGLNELVETKAKSIPMIFLEQYKDFLVIILIVAALISGFLGDLKKISSTEISDFTFKKGMLIYKSTMHLEKGIGYDIGYKGKILFDKTKRVIVILIENQPRSGEWFCVTTNISVLLNLGKLCEIRIKI